VITSIVLTTACADSTDGALRIGVKDFEEQKILAEMAAGLLRGNGYPVGDIINCGDTFTCQKALRAGKIDLMVEYTGTGLVFMGKSVSRQGNSLARVRRLYGEIGLVWLGPLGFDNRYRVVVRTDRAAARNAQAIADLHNLEGRLRVACPAEYLRRPVDGFYALLRTYGLKNKISAKPLLLDDPERRYRALLDGKVDIAIGYGTDGSMRDPRLTVLKDTKNFFPSYNGSFLVRQKTLAQYPKLKTTLGKLENLISTDQMRALNYAVQVEGQHPRAVAERFLKKRELAVEAPRARRHRPDLTVKMHSRDLLGGMRKLALRAVRAAFPNRAVFLRRADNPRSDLARGRARLAILGAERFFMDSQGRAIPERDERVEAVAVLGTRLLHFFRRKDAKGDPATGRIGVARRGSGSALVAEVVLGQRGKRPVVWAAPQELFKRLAGGDLDSVLILAETGAPQVVHAMRKYNFKLASLAQWMTPRGRALLPYLRKAVIGASTYPTQAYPVDTFSSQVVLAAPGRKVAFGGASGGQAAALPVAGFPLDRQQMHKLVEATGRPETPDPVLPSAWSAVPLEDKKRDTRLSIGTKLINSLVIAFLIWLAWIVMRKEEPDANEDDEDDEDEEETEQEDEDKRAIRPSHSAR
jgi:glycine betaine/choline ABC-type transport system substrate-binding protein